VTSAPGTVDRFFRTGNYRQQIDQVEEGKEAEHSRLGRGQQQVTTRLPDVRAG
jgi:hypothetical protein